MSSALDLEDLEVLLPYAHPSLAAVPALRDVLAPRDRWSPGDLARVSRLVARHAGPELHRASRFDPVHRWYLRLALTDDVEIWLLTWTPGQGTRPHDHGGASGAYTVLRGEVTEAWRDGTGPSRRGRRPVGSGSAFGPDRVHVVRNDGTLDAASVHAYSPPLLPLGTDVTLEDPPG